MCLRAAPTINGGETNEEQTMNTVTLYTRWDGYDYVTPVSFYHQRANFRTVCWCTTHDYPLDRSVLPDKMCIDEDGTCRFVNKLVEV